MNVSIQISSKLDDSDQTSEVIFDKLIRNFMCSYIWFDIIYQYFIGYIHHSDIT